MLAVQFNKESDSVLEAELKKRKGQLPTENFCRQLKNYLSQKEWRKADEETAWLFYLVMVSKRYASFPSWNELCRSFPSETLNEIDQLGVKYSEEHFGFSIQKRIWESVGGKLDVLGDDSKTWEKFGKQVGWYVENNWRMHNSLPFSIQSPEDNLPVLSYTRSLKDRGFLSYVATERIEHWMKRWHLFSRIKT